MTAEPQVMSTSNAGAMWAGIIRLSPEERPFAMADVLAALLVQDEAGREERLGAMLEAEGELEEAELAGVITSRLQALATFGAGDALELTEAWEQAEREQAASIGMRRVFALQAACRNLSLDEVSRVQAFMPTVRQLSGLPPARAPGSVDIEAARAALPPKQGLFTRRFSRR